MTSQKQHIIKTSILITGLLVGIILAQNPQILENRAQTPQCSVTTAYCRWDKVSTATAYGYIISDLSNGTDVSRGTSDQNQIAFTIIPGHTYRCSVSPINNCGVGISKKTEQTCTTIGQRIGGAGGVSPTPTPSPSVSLEPTGSIFPTLTGTLLTDFSPTPRFIKVPTPTVKPLIPVKTLNLGTKFISYGMALVLAVCVLLIIFRHKGRKKRKSPSISLRVNEKEAKSYYVKIAPGPPENVYFLKPYKINSEDKSLWVTLTKQNTQILGLSHNLNLTEGYYKVTGKLEKADDIPFIDIAKIEKVDKPS
ncbi:hypothetical protein A3D77_00575 [Candidatus Gottesmanbacteria bacterium RIFCSPHIGHO2_02_FULL_39_11]|uniref:Uncharacterized protein n=1 Tax=Candidatus Gottesmanbacteria bacterium RIFCSPHIGHO2_02_FULL_39_11 TaxID=1798382 RepID=A0A1F5ZL92_9BACT|nr:MAG: hypothetical protein A3D77_00575 [Candidatus Gottesmanbacteria bacterium RIFCSPHIGHO2_02_FULL_39_11]